MNKKNPFWKIKALDEMSDQEWEALCDGCGKCCLHKLQDEDTDEIYFTNVACNQLDCQTGLCKNYANRFNLNEDCLKLTRDKIEDFVWLPNTCAYRLLAEGKELPEWHPLITGNREAMQQAGISVCSMTLYYEKDVNDWEEHIIQNL